MTNSSHFIDPVKFEMLNFQPELGKARISAKSSHYSIGSYQLSCQNQEQLRLQSPMQSSSNCHHLTTGPGFNSTNPATNYCVSRGNQISSGESLHFSVNYHYFGVHLHLIKLANHQHSVYLHLHLKLQS